MLLTRSSLNARPSVGRASAFRAAPTPVRSSFAVRAKTAEVEVKSKKEEKKEEEEEFEDGVLPSTAQVETLLNALCNETEIAELNLKMGAFSLKVKRSMSGHTAAPAAPAPAPVVAAAPAPVVSAPTAEPSVEDTVDESLVTVTAPKVGIFRRGKYAAGKRVGKGNCVNEGDKVKKGQPIGYIEQLGTFIAVGSSIAGEVVKFHVEDGKPVEYLQLVAEVAPYFGGHIIGDSKHA